MPDFSNQVYQISQKIEHQTIKTEKTVPVIVGVNNKAKLNNISFKLLKLMGICYSMMGFLLASSPWYYSAFACFLGLNLAFISALILVLNKPLPYFSSTWYIALLLKFALQMVLSLPLILAMLGSIYLSIGSIEGKGEGSIAGLAGIIIFCINIVLIFIYVTITKKFENCLSRWNQFLLLLGTSWLGLFLGWLTYQFLPIFPNR
ncbi:hypothetical protein PN497_06130 [Sphaerospermopsis kisseleviana CS-549]|uniref:Yip1 domain-containing protein n=1 Tax=Sphaerospermopsis kisseleviana CS-549 TaxID=3021783 RepID=A0ABT4ZNS1_9CYAN|nr:hypothetical protein [Sphaerospermopsis kisseleviana]MDB9440944.1 hypothetical protein [Sphaerospermopsis kisseleviana CS-549]BAZ79838.1 hypothetical protein NIES73_10840 [Sphaerospermopsis kisseleviana NIES-73]